MLLFLLKSKKPIKILHTPEIIGNLQYLTFMASLFNIRRLLNRGHPLLLSLVHFEGSNVVFQIW